MEEVLVDFDIEPSTTRSYKDLVDSLNSGNETAIAKVNEYLKWKNIPSPKDMDSLQWKSLHGSVEDKRFVEKINIRNRNEDIELARRNREDNLLSNRIARFLSTETCKICSAVSVAIIYIGVTIILWVYGLKEGQTSWGFLAPAIILTAAPVLIGCCGFVLPFVLYICAGKGPN